jgi:phosphate/phosphite/phosphonate ABC transporter binding protein
MKKFFIIILFLCFADLVYSQEIPTINVGVLAKRGKKISINRWSSTANYLTHSLPEYQFHIVPLTFKEINDAVELKRIHFLFVNSGIYVDLSARYSIERIATVKRSLHGSSHVNFGGVIFTRYDNKKINNFKDLIGCRFAAVDKNSFGGWIAALRELVKDGLKPEQDFSSLLFTGTHDDVVYAVLKGKVDAGTVRTDTIERMADEGKIKISNIKVITGSTIQDRRYFLIKKFPFRLSTRLYPEWPMAKLSHVSDDLAEQVAFSLIKMPANSQAIIKGKIKGWTIPKNYREVDRAFQELKLSIYSNLGAFSLWDSILKYWIAFLLGGVCFVIMFITTIYIIKLNMRLKDSEKLMREMATHDNLTGLPNRNLFIEFSTKALASAQRQNKSTGVIFIDLDHFKQVNDTYGHQIGDELLQNVANRLTSHLRKEDIIARFGGDEFVGLLHDIDEVKELEVMVKRIIYDISNPYFLSGYEITIGCSVGIAISPENGDQIEGLLKRADQALYNVKKQNRGNYTFFDTIE